MENNKVQMTSEDALFENVSKLIEDSRKQVAKAVNTAMVYTYYGVGQYIVEYEQGGEARAEYGKGVLKRLSERLMGKFGKGWSVETLTNSRKFYTIYSNSKFMNIDSQTPMISSPVDTKFRETVISGYEIQENRPSSPKFILPWSHYQIIMREDNPDARRFYEIEAYNQQWSKRQLQRQVASSLYERLALRDRQTYTSRPWTNADVCELLRSI